MKTLQDLTLEERILLNLFIDCVHGIVDTYENEYLTKPYGEDISKWFANWIHKESESISFLLQEVFEAKEFDFVDKSDFFKTNIDSFFNIYQISTEDMVYIKNTLSDLAKREIYIP